MKRSIKFGLVGAILSILASCGGSNEPAIPAAEPERAQAAGPSKARLDATARPDGAGGQSSRGTYIVELIEAPAVAYEGGVTGRAATKPAEGQKMDSDHPAVVSYRNHLHSRHDAVLANVGGGKKLHSYAYVFNGFAAEMSDAQAQKLAKTPGVLSVVKDEIRQLDTASTPAFLGLSGNDGFWKQTEAKGENVIIGIVDTGVWPEHPSFSDRNLQGGQTYSRIRGWRGSCSVGEEFTAANCNRKLIGARYYNAGFGGNAAIDSFFPGEINSPRDVDGHGTHTASTAGGNAEVPAAGVAAVLGKISGMAPRARIAAYKVCWGGAAGGCTTSDSVAAIDQAVADGVDVINFSISGTRTNFLDPVEQAFLRAASAGVFVAASAGNSGPATSTVAHPSPWITTVAAGTHNRDGAGSTTLGSGTTFNGASMATLGGVGPLPLIDSTAAGVAGANAIALALCFTDAEAGGAVLDPIKVTGKIVVCDRGVNARVSKSQAVLDAGGLGMILLNTSVNSLNADLHSVPTVHLPVTDRVAVKAYAAAVNATATINQAVLVFTAPAPFTAAFSSRGPSLAANGNLLKPDIIAPGQDILAGVSPVGYNGKLFDLLSGTSMSSPHIAGIAALLKELHPRWSPMAIKSALMTSAGDVLDRANTISAVIFRQGAGHVRPLSAAEPGLVFNSGPRDWLGFLCGTGQVPVASCTAARVPVLAASDLNVPSIAISDTLDKQTVTRRVTNVGRGVSTYTPSYEMPGFTVAVSPASLTLFPGQTRSFTATFTRTTAAFGAYAGGQLTWTGGTVFRTAERHVVRIPLVVRPNMFSAPASVSGSYNVKFGYTGTFTARPRGLVAATTTDGTIGTNQEVPISVTIPAGTTHARFSLFDADVTPGSDIDLYLLNAAGTVVVGRSEGPTSAEEINLPNLPAGDYTVLLVGFSVPGTSNFRQYTWALGATSAGNMTVSAPASATAGTTGAINLAFSGLVAGIKYLGSIVYGGDPALPDPTIVTVTGP